MNRRDGAGMGAGLVLSIALLGTEAQCIALPLRGLITGAGIGGAHYLLLRGVTSRAPAWALIVALSWVLDWVFGSSGALVFQLLTGLAQAWMRQVSASRRPARPAPSGE